MTTTNADKACYAHGTFFVVPLSTDAEEAGFRGVVSVDAADYVTLKDAGLMDSRVNLTMVISDNDLTDEEGWTGEAGLRTIKVHNTDPKAQLMIAEGSINDIVSRGIVDGTYCDLTISELG